MKLLQKILSRKTEAGARQRRRKYRPTVERLESRELLTITQLTFDPTDHRTPSLNNGGDVVYSAQVGGQSEIFKLNAGASTPIQLTSGPNNKTNPSIADNGDVVYFKDGGSGGIGWQVIRRSAGGSEGAIEFSSRNRSAHRDANMYSGIASNGTSISGYNFFPGLFGSNTRRFNVSGVGQLADNFYGSFGGGYNYPDVNAQGDVLIASTGGFFSNRIYKTSTSGPFPGTSVAIASMGRINDSGDIVVVSGDLNLPDSIRILSGSTYTETTFIGSGSWADINNSKQVVFENFDGQGRRQLFLYTSVVDLSATALTIANSNVNFTWSISGSQLSVDPSVKLYWSDNDKFELGTDTESYAVDTTGKRAVGSYPGTVSVSKLKGVPKNFLLLVADPSNAIRESDEPNAADFGAKNVIPLTLPDIEMGKVRWLSLEQDGGIEASYFIRNADIGSTMRLNLYWSSDKTFEWTLDDLAATLIISNSELLTRNEVTPKTIRIAHSLFIIKTPPTYANYLIAFVDPLDLAALQSMTPSFGDIPETNEANNVDTVKLVPLVINVVTHGFNADVDKLHKYGHILESEPESGSILDGRVKSYVPEWESNDGFREGMTALLLSKLDKAAATFYTSVFHSARAAKTFEDRAAELRSTIKTYQKVSKMHAEQAAADIVHEIESRFLLDVDPVNGQLQHISLVGHSRGAAVNALASQLLHNDGYIVDEYVSLDGYSTDWTNGGGDLGDINIADVTVANTKINYLVGTGLEKVVLDGLKSYSGLLTGLFQYLSDKPILSYIVVNSSGLPIADQDLKNLHEICKIMFNKSYRTIYSDIVTGANDLRAPVRPGFQNITTYEYTDHLNITDYYFDSDSYLLSYLGKNRTRR